MARAAHELSAGGVVVRDRSCVVIVPTRRAADGRKVLALPKGHVDAGETPAQAALREVREEAGVDATLREELGDIRYFYTRSRQRIAKVVRFFLLDYAGGSPEDHDHEVEIARWMPLDEAVTALTYEGEREMAARARDRLK
jgi:8-oxo-dGTP pyrophosphatase MutT (NUDIX family)